MRICGLGCIRSNGFCRPNGKYGCCSHNICDCTEQTPCAAAPNKEYKLILYPWIKSPYWVLSAGPAEPRRLRRQWCDERRMWTAEWNEIVFNDESRFCLKNHGGRIRVWRHRGDRMLNSCVMLRHTGPAPGIMIWSGIEYQSRTPKIRIGGTLNSQRYISEVLEPVVLPYSQGLPTAIFQQYNAQPHVARIVQRFFDNRQIELLPWQFNHFILDTRMARTLSSRPRPKTCRSGGMMVNGSQMRGQRQDQYRWTSM
ncbi:hypothetical protein LAZ67_21001680 [Cordylochernes scorpioides]|uniref:Uncharacterized protein n=1 Tax=Cordylochernes scorpioides TaxID=51811 RepID=A0ABY6LPK9_9ARAC|nr:hypothetical protein LAZ67_21001680 [Cordylochernes scorpioides]